MAGRYRTPFAWVCTLLAGGRPSLYCVKQLHKFKPFGKSPPVYYRTGHPGAVVGKTSIGELAYS